MRLVKLTHRNGDCVYVNPAQVIAVEPHPLYATPAGKSRVEQVGTGSKIFFGLTGRVCSDEFTTETEPYWHVVVESPKDVAGLFLSPLGRDAA